MEWSHFQKIDVAGLSGAAVHEAAVLNRRIGDLEKFRERVDRNIAPPLQARPGTPQDEAIRREVVLRTDIMRLEQASQRDPAANLELLAQANNLLAQRGTHTQAGSI